MSVSSKWLLQTNVVSDINGQMIVSAKCLFQVKPVPVADKCL